MLSCLSYASLSVILDFQADDISGAESARVVSNSANENKSNIAAAASTAATEDIWQLSTDPGYRRDDRQIVLSDTEAFPEALAIVDHSSGYSTHSCVAGCDGAAAQASSNHHKSTAARYPKNRAESVASTALAIPGDRHGEGERERRVRQASEYHAIGDVTTADYTGEL